MNSNLCGTMNQQNREKWLEATLSKISKGSRILDAGAGELQYKKFCKHLNYVSQDFGQYDGAGDGKGLQMQRWDQTKLDIISDIMEIPEPDESFDAIMCIEVLEHLPNPLGALREITRLLKFKGDLIVTAPFCALTHFSPYFYQTGYSRYFYEYWLEDLGYKIIDMQWNGNYFEYIGQEIRRIPIIARDYSDKTIYPIEISAINTILGLLTRMSKADNGSEQLLSFGIHVLAKKLKKFNKNHDDE